MRNKLKFILVAFLILRVSLFPIDVFAAWAGVDNFDSYTQGNDLNGTTGGSGFGANEWVAVAAVDVSAVTCGGANGVEDVTPLDAEAGTYRKLAADTTSGIATIALRRTDKTSGQWQFILMDDSQATDGNAANRNIRINMGTADLTMTGSDGVNPVTRTLVSGYLVNTCYQVHIKFDNALSSYQGRVGTDDWSLAVQKETAGSGTTRFVRITANGDVSGTAYFDELGIGSEPGGGETTVPSLFLDMFWSIF